MLDSGYAEDQTVLPCSIHVQYALRDANYGICEICLKESSKSNGYVTKL